MNGSECRFCHQWEPSADDAYCSGCGALLLLLDVDPPQAVLISTIAPAKEFRFRNHGTRTMQVTIQPRDGLALPGVTFEPGMALELPPGAEVPVRVSVNGQRLPPGFHRSVALVCTVDGDTRKQRTITLEVRSGPMPQLVTPSLDFDQIQEGKSVERVLGLSNNGSVPLRIKSVRAEGSAQLTLAEDYDGRVIRYGETLGIRVVWQTAREESSAAESMIRIELANHPDVLLVPASAHTFRYRLELKPSSLRVPQALAKRDYTNAVHLENLGTTDIEIDAIEADQPWIGVVSRASRFTLLCAESAAKRNPSPTTFARTFDFKVVCSPRGLSEGKHHGTISVRPRGQDPVVLDIDLTVVQAKDYSDYIGIDFGTTNSVVALRSSRANGAIELVKDAASGKELIPSVLVFDDPDTYKIGAAAKNEADSAPDRTVRSIKRVMGYERDRTFFDRPYSAAHLASLIVRKLVQLAEERLHDDSANGAHYNIRKAIITVPANFHDLQIRDVLEACAAAGLDTEEEKAQRVEARQSEEIGAAVSAGIILDEPSAAVLYYLDHLRRTQDSAEISKAIAREQGLKLLVFDYGGGTLDVAVASVTAVPGGGTGLRILANLGDNDIGGDHIDVLVMRELLRRAKHELTKFDFDTNLVAGNFTDVQRRSELEGWSSDLWREVLRARSQWKDLAERVKIQMADAKPAPIDISPDLLLRIDNGRLEQATRAIKLPPLAGEAAGGLLQPVLARCEELIRSSLVLAEVKPEEIDYILHTGRQSLLPLIRTRVRAVFPNLGESRDLLEEQHLKVCVAKGAALYGSMRDRLVAREARLLLLSDGRRLPHAYGVETFTNPVEPEFDEVIERGAQYPIERTKPYPPDMIPPGGYLNLKFYQNTGTSNAIIGNRNVSLIGQISIETADHAGVDVTFAVGANRTLRVFANGSPVTIEPARLQEAESWTG